MAYSKEDEFIHFCDIKTDTAGFVHKMVMVDTNSGGGGLSNMIKTHDGKYVITTGYIENNMGDIYLYKRNSDLEHDTLYPGNYTYDSLCPYQIESGIIDITDCLLITDVGETPSPKEYFASLNAIPIKAYPNPVNGNQLTFQYLNTKHHKNMELRCFNIFGKLVHKEKVYQHQGESEVYIVNWKPGIYVALVYSNNKVVGLTKFVVR